MQICTSPLFLYSGKNCVAAKWEYIFGVRSLCGRTFCILGGFKNEKTGCFVRVPGSRVLALLV